MKFGEMYAWTNRLRGILQVGGPSKTGRLNNLRSDLELATDLVNCGHSKALYMRVGEEISESIKATA